MTAASSSSVPEIDWLLSTTRSVRRRLDLRRPVPRDLIEQCLQLAMQAPIGGNVEVRRWLVVTDQPLKDEIAAAYRVGATPYLERALNDAIGRGDSLKQKVIESASYLATHLEHVPLLVIPCLAPGVDFSSNEAAASRYASIFPAVWSFQLALHSRGLGSALTTLHLHEEGRVAELLGIPSSVSQVALLPVAYTIGENFRAARRIDAKSVTYWNAWPDGKSPVA